jgi:tetratricopeptide (TPR) repeat protein
MKALTLAACMICSLTLPGLNPLLIEARVWANTAKKPTKANPAHQKLFRRGMEAYEAKSYDDAIDVFTQILQKQADNMPAKIQLARSLYQLKRFPEAYKLFQTVELSLLEPEASYEYGQTAFRANDFNNAMEAFRNVPNGHPLYDLAGYYGGISAFKIGNFQLAIDMLEQAVVLPSKLVRSQKLYQKEAEKQLLLKQKQEVQAATPPLGGAASQGSTAPTLTPLQSDSDRIYRYLRSDRGVTLIPRYVTQNQSSSDREVAKKEIKSAELRTTISQLKSTTKAGSPQYLLELQLSGKALEGSSGEIGILPDVRKEQELALIKKSDRVRSLGMVDLTAAIEWPIADGSTLGLHLGASMQGANGDFAKGYTTPRLGIFLGQKNNLLETHINIEAHARLEEGDMLFLNTRQLGRVIFALPHQFQVSIQGELAQYSYNQDRIDGPDWSGRILSEFGYQRSDDFGAFLGAFFELQQANRLHDLPGASVIEFDSNLIGASFRSDIKLFSWARLSLLGQVVDRNYASLAPSRTLVEPLLESVYPASIHHFAVQTMFSVSF